MNKFKAIQHVAEDDPLLGLRIVEFNPTELCNRQCVFCPRVDPEVFPNRNLHMDITTVEKVIGDLVAHDYKGGIIFSGWGEPTLNRNICQLIKVASKYFPVMLFSNGDKIFDSDWYTLDDFIEAGVDTLFVDAYDDVAQYERWLPTIQKYQDLIKIKVSRKYEFPIHVFVNRAGTVLNTKVVESSCFITGSKAFIDWDGTLQLCCHDWTRTGAMGNVLNTPLSVLWKSEAFNAVRKKLMHEVRTAASGPCSKCDAHGDQRNSKVLKEIWAPVLK
jgi:radical SAM protein with 4Fe4S-binding SPASM domain